MDVTLCTFHCGDARSLIVLADWLRFLGQPELPVLVSTMMQREDNFTLPQLQEHVPHAQVWDCPTGGLNIQALDPAGIYESIEQAKTKWVVLVKLDTLVYVDQPQADFLPQVIDQIKQAGAWGAMGSFTPPDLDHNEQGVAVTARYSNNYSIFRRSDWLGVFDQVNPEFVQQIRMRQLVPDSRFVTEDCIEGYLKNTGRRMLFLEDTQSRNALHINQWGQTLLDIRQRYLKQEGVDPFLNRYTQTQGEPWDCPEWQRYYGWPRNGIIRRSRVKLGKVRRQLGKVLKFG